MSWAVGLLFRVTCRFLVGVPLFLPDADDVAIQCFFVLAQYPFHFVLDICDSPSEKGKGCRT